MSNSLSILNDSERQKLRQPVRLDLGQYRKYRHDGNVGFVIDLDVQPLARLVDDAALGLRLYEFMSIRRKGDLLNYLWVTFIDVDDEIANGIRSNRRHYDPAVQIADLPFVEFDKFFRWSGEDTEPYTHQWLPHRNGEFLRNLQKELLALVLDLQARLRAKDDFLIQRELRLIDSGTHPAEYQAIVDRQARLVCIIDEYSCIAQSQWLIDGISKLIKRDDVQSVSCPFGDFFVWRVLVAEQVRRSEKSGLPPSHAFYLSGPDSGLYHVPYEDWGGDIHIPYEGSTGADLVILPDWQTFYPDKARIDGKLSWAIGGKRCHHVLSEVDYGELGCATRTPFGDWFLYTSTAPYENCNPELDEKYGIDTDDMPRG